MAAAAETERGEGAPGFSPALGAGWPHPTAFPFGINFSPLASASGIGDREGYPPPLPGQGGFCTAACRWPQARQARCCSLLGC